MPKAPTEIARELTRAQRRALVAVVENECCWRPAWRPGLRSKRMFWVGDTLRVREQTILALWAAALLELDDDILKVDEAYDPTPLGYAVVEEITKRKVGDETVHAT